MKNWGRSTLLLTCIWGQCWPAGLFGSHWQKLQQEYSALLPLEGQHSHNNQYAHLEITRFMIKHKNAVLMVFDMITHSLQPTYQIHPPWSTSVEERHLSIFSMKSFFQLLQPNKRRESVCLTQTKTKHES